MAKSMTAAQRRRALILKAEVGCLAHYLDGDFKQADLHHLVEGYRIGHDHTVPLCPWHHRGVPFDGRTKTQTAAMWGPALSEAPRLFHDKYGTDEELLELANELVQQFEKRNPARAGIL